MESPDVEYINELSVFEGAIAKTGKGKLVVADFSANWCVPCREIAPTFNALATAYKDDATFIKIDADDGPQLVDRYKISALPTFVFFRDGKELDGERFSGADIRQLERKVGHLTMKMGDKGQAPSSKSNIHRLSEVTDQDDPSSGMYSMANSFADKAKNAFGFGNGGGTPNNFPGQGHTVGETDQGASSSSWLSTIASWLPGTSRPKSTGSKTDVNADAKKMREQNQEAELLMAQEAEGKKTEQEAEQKMEIEEFEVIEGTTVVQIRFPDATKLKLRLKLTDPISSIRALLCKTKPEFSGKSFVLCNGASFPIKEIENEEQGIGDAGLANALLTIKLK